MERIDSLFSQGVWVCILRLIVSDIECGLLELWPLK